MPFASDLYYAAHPLNQAKDYNLVLIHGAGGTHLDWPAEVRRLPGCRVLALDLPGHGKSGCAGEQAVQGYANKVMSWLDELSLSQVILCGHSMGGAIAQVIALQHHERLKGIVLVGTGARLRVAPEILENTASQVTISSAIDTIVQWSFSPKAGDHFRKLSHRSIAANRPSVLHGDYLACNSFDIMERVQEIDLPALVLCGSDDVMTPARYAQYLANRIPGAALKIIADAGHMVMLEKPQEVASAMESFIAKLTQTPTQQINLT